MKKIMLLALIGFSFEAAYSQQNSTNVLKLFVDKTKHLAITTSYASVDVEGYDGDALIIEAVVNKDPKNMPPDAAGLKHIGFSNRPAEDNTIGYKLVKDNDLLSQISLTPKCKYLHIRVPNHLYLFSLTINNMRPDGYLSFKYFKGAFQLDGLVNTANVSNVTGPFNISVRSGKLILKDILWSTDTAWPFKSFKSDYPAPYIITSAANIDISVPADLNADLRLNSGYGQIYSDLKLSAPPSSTTLTLNGGGLLLIANSKNGNIYLRKQQ